MQQKQPVDFIAQGGLNPIEMVRALGQHQNFPAFLVALPNILRDGPGTPGVLGQSPERILNSGFCR